MAQSTLSAEDRLQICEVVALWAVFEDTGAAKDWARLFTADGVLTGTNGKSLEGHAALAENQRKRWTKPGGQDVAHVFDTPLIVATETGAIASHYGVLVARAGCSSLGAVSRRTYHLRRDDGDWRIFFREIDHLPLGGGAAG